MECLKEEKLRLIRELKLGITGIKEAGALELGMIKRKSKTVQ